MCTRTLELCVCVSPSCVHSIIHVGNSTDNAAPCCKRLAENLVSYFITVVGRSAVKNMFLSDVGFPWPYQGYDLTGCDDVLFVKYLGLFYFWRKLLRRLLRRKWNKFALPKR